MEGTSLTKIFKQMRQILGEVLTDEIKEKLWVAKKQIVQQVLLVSRSRMQS